MTSRRNALDNDLLADLGISIKPTPNGQATSDGTAAESLPSAPSGHSSATPPIRTKRIGVDVSEKVWVATKILAAQEGTTVAHLIRSHLDELINDQT